MRRFAKELLRDRGKTSAASTAVTPASTPIAPAKAPNTTPATTAIFGPFTATINDYLRNELKVDDDHVYEILTGEVQPWNYGRYVTRFPDASNTLRQTHVGQSVS